MKKIILMIMLFSASHQAMAVLGVADTAVVLCTNCGSEATQNSNYLTQLDIKAKQVLVYQQMLIDTEMMIRTLQNNPVEVIVPNVDQLLKNQNRINQLADDISNNWDKVGDNLMKDLNHPNTIGLGQGARTEIWSDARIAAVKNSMQIIDLFRSTYKTDAKKQEDLTKKAKAAEGSEGGPNASLQAISELNAEQLRSLNKMVTALNEAQSALATERAVSIKKDQQIQEQNDRLWTLEKWGPPKRRPASPDHF